MSRVVLCCMLGELIDIDLAMHDITVAHMLSEYVFTKAIHLVHTHKMAMRF